jgi:hypothetical protein
MAFEWLPFLDSHRIHYVTTGPNVSRGHVAVHCPFCGSADKSQHMSINLQGKGWRCFRNRDQHKGVSPVYLVQALLNTTLDRAKAIVGDAVFIPDDWMNAVMNKMNPQGVAVRKHKKLVLPDEFKRLQEKPSARHFINYLTGPTRKFTKREVLLMTDQYDLHYAVAGPMKGRIIFPVYYEDELVTWTGRSIYPDAFLRYKTLSTDPEVEEHPALGPINDYLLWYDDLVNDSKPTDRLILCEGPFDALKVNVLGRRHGIKATCFFTASPSVAQIDTLHTLIDRFAQCFLLLDRGTLGTALRVQGALSSLRLPYLTLPNNIKDPGLLDACGLLSIID